MKEHSNIKKALWDDSHRLWSLPNMPWTMNQTWNDVLLANYPIKLDVLRKLVPDVLPLDQFDGMGWIGVVPFHMTGIRLRGMPPVPGTDRFPELNIRTYVTINGKPGVYFFSLDAPKRLAVWLAQTFYSMPYFFADTKMKNNRSVFEFENTRRTEGEEAKFVCNYQPVSEPFHTIKGSFDYWMTERYCFYTVNKKGVPLRCDILHLPWLLQQVEAEISHNTMLSSQGILIEGVQPILHFSKKVEVRTWPLVKAD